MIYSLPEIVFFRNFFGLVPCLLMIACTKRWSVLYTRKAHIHILRSVVSTISLFCLFQAFSLMPIADVTAISFTQGLFVACLTYPILKEKLELRSVMAILVGFVGVLIFLHPNSSFNLQGSAMAIMHSIGHAFVIIMIRYLTKTDHPLSVVVYNGLLASIISGVILPWYWITPISFYDWVSLVAIGLLSILSQYCFTKSYYHAPVGVVVPFIYTQFLWSLLFGYFVFAEIPTYLTLIGSFIIIFSNLYVSYTSRKQKSTTVDHQSQGERIPEEKIQEEKNFSNKKTLTI